MHTLQVGLVLTLLEYSLPGQTPVAFQPSCREPNHFTARVGGSIIGIGPAGELQFSPNTRLEWPGADPTAIPHGGQPSQAMVGQFLGNDPLHWCPVQQTYSSLLVPQLYPGIDLVYRTLDSPNLEFDLVVAPGHTPSQIHLRIGRTARLDPYGNLLLNHDGSLRIQPPFAYQLVDGKQKQVDARFSLHSPGNITFDIGEYDRKKTLTIDPVVGFSTYVGGKGFDAIYGITQDTTGDIYVTGEAFSPDFQGSAVTGSKKLFVAKLNSAGTGFVYTTFIGGTNGDTGSGIAVDSAKNVWVTGSTLSRDFPTTSTAYRSSPSGQQDAFVVKLDPTGNLIYSTYLGAAGADFGTAIALDPTGSAYVTGYTSSLHFPVTTTAVFGGGFYDAFIAKFSSAGTLAYSTLLGGLGNDTAWAIAVDSSGNAYIAGETDSLNFPLQNAYQATNGGSDDAFVAKLDPSGSHLVFSTYLGGLQQEQVTGIALDSNLNVYVTGATASANFPLTQGSYQSSLKGLYNAFVTKLSPTGTTLLASTYLGGTVSDNANAILIDSAGNAWITGATHSSNFPVVNPIQVTNHGGFFDGFLSILDPSLAFLRFSTYLGGTSDDRAYGLSLYGGAAYIAGATNSVDFPITTGSAETTFSGIGDGFVSKVTPDLILLASVPTTGSSQSFTFTFTDQAGFQDIAGAQIVINSALTGVNSCYILFARPDLISLVDDTGNPVLGHVTSTSLGAPATLQNSQCSVLASLTSQAGSGTTVTLTVFVVFKPTFPGLKTVWANYNNIAGVSSGFQPLATYTATTTSQSLAPVSVTPASGSGQAQAFTFTFADPYGAPDISGSQIVFNTALSGTNACYLLFASSNTLSLASDNANTFTTAILGQPTVLQNSQCILYVGNSYQSASGTTLKLTVFVAFKLAFAGAKNIYANINNNAGTKSAFPQLGSWTVPSTLPALGVTSASPAASTAPSQMLTFVFSDPSGYADIAAMQIIINPTPVFTNSCVIQFQPATGLILLSNNGATSTTSAAIGQTTTLQNSQCIVNAAASSQSGFGSYLTLNLFVTMKTTGLQNIYSSLTSSASTSTQTLQFATWTVTNPAIMTSLSVFPLTGAIAAGSNQPFTFTLANPAGADEISGALIVLYPSLQGAGACYILWGHNTNLVSLASDNAATFTSGTLGSVTTLQNSQCVIDTSKSLAVQAGNTVNLTIAVSFKSVYRQFSQLYSWVNVQNRVAQLSGWQVMSRFTVQ